MLLAIIKTLGDSLKHHPAETPHRHCLTFLLHGMQFGIDTRFIKEIARYNILAEPRGKPSFVRGLFRHQGKMIPVLDLAALYGTHKLELGRRTCILIATLGIGKWQRDIGLLVDEVKGLADFDTPELKPMPDVAHRMLKVEIVEGLVRQEKDYLIVIDALQLIPDADMKALNDYMRQEFAR
jgi:chemotaxis signal transduction protein